MACQWVRKICALVDLAQRAPGRRPALLARAAKLLSPIAGRGAADGYRRSGLLHGIHLIRATTLARDTEATAHWTAAVAGQIPHVQSIRCRSLLGGVSWKPPMRHYRRYEPSASRHDGGLDANCHRLCQPDARRLTQALHREQLATYGFADDPAGSPAGEFTAPHGTFLIAAARGGSALACGGWRTAGPGTAEIKRMYVAPAARGRGLGRRVLEALESDAVRRGMTRMILETGARNHVAFSLYAACDYTRVPSCVAGRDPEVNRAMQKALRRPPAKTA